MSVAVERLETIDLRPERLNRTIIRLSVPSVMESMLTTLVYLVDAALIGWLNDPAALAAVGLSGTLMWAADGLFQALSISASALVARSWGGRDFEEARAVAGQAILLSVLAAFLLMGLLMPISTLFLRLMGADPDVVNQGTTYVRILLATSPVSFVLVIANSIMRATGDTQKPMFITGVMNLCNVVLAYVLIFGVGPIPRLELVGAALSSSIARAIGGALALGVLFSSRTPLRLRLAHLRRRDCSLIWRIVRISLPNIGETIISRLGYILFMRIVTSLGTVALAAHQLALRIESLAYMPGWGLATAAAALVGQALGAEKEDVAEAGIRRTLLMGNGAMVLLGGVFVFFGSSIVQLFGVQDAELAALATLAIRIAALELIGLCSVMIIAGCLRGAGDTRTPMIVTLLGTLLFRVPTTYLFTIVLGAGLKGVWLATSTDWTMRALIMFFFYVRGAWKTVEV
ncbi:MAG TPA: MATE family efflux transporter [Chloroflexi bacterium]|nr:MATE family efflux transporter [Chloroflexota bacterium]